MATLSSRDVSVVYPLRVAGSSSANVVATQLMRRKLIVLSKVRNSLDRMNDDIPLWTASYFNTWSERLLKITIPDNAN